MKIFLSSTYEDLKFDRKAAIDVLERIGEVYAMEKFFASDHRSREECLERLRECDAIVLIIGERYGSIDDVSQCSITELEYKTAKELKLTRFVFVKHNTEGRWVSVESDDGRKRKHEVFKATLDGETLWKAFHDQTELKTEIALAFYGYIQRHGLPSGRTTAFLSPDEFFGPYQDRSRLFHHGFALVGRGSLIQSLKDFVTAPSRVAMLIGRGGIGKTKILKEALSRIGSSQDTPTILLLREGIEFDLDAARELPAGRLLVVVDDAHRAASLAPLLSFAQQCPDRIKLVLSTRPYGVDAIRAHLSHTGFADNDVFELPEVRELKGEEVEALATQVLSNKNSPLVVRLVAVSKDSPLMTVLGGQLLARKGVHPDLLLNADEFRREVLARFRDLLIGQVSDQLSPEAARKTLQLIAALAPFRPGSEALVRRAADFLQVKPHDFLLALSELERAGALLRRGFSVRITPDILSDHILQEACLATSGQPTGYAYRVFLEFGDLFLENLLRNLSELDWRIGQGESAQLLSDIWKDIGKLYLSSDNTHRVSLLKTIENVAHLQPREAMQFARLATANPVTAGTQDNTDTFFHYSHDDVLEAIPGVLKEVAHHPSHLREAANLLWQLGRDDKRQTSGYPGHAIRILKELAAYQPRKPLFLHETILDCIDIWLTHADAFDHPFSPIDILDSLLAREGMETTSSSLSISFRSFGINFKATKTVRSHGLSLLETLALRDQPKIKRRVLKSLLEALREPMSLLNRVPSDEELASWDEENRRILSIVETLLCDPHSILLGVEALPVLRQMLSGQRYSQFSNLIERVLNIIPDTYEAKCTCS